MDVVRLPGLEVPEDVARAYPPDRRALLDYFRGQIELNTVRIMSECDHACHVEEYLAGLNRIWRDEWPDEEPLDWYPREVLSLSRWSPVSVPTRSQALIGQGFAAAALLYFEDPSENEPRFSSDSLIRLILACAELGRDAQGPLLQLTTYALNEMEHWSDEFELWCLSLPLQLNLAGWSDCDGVVRWCLETDEAVVRHFANHDFFRMRFPGISRKQWVELWQQCRARREWPEEFVKDWDRFKKPKWWQMW